MKRFNFLSGFIILLMTIVIGGIGFTSCNTGPMKQVLPTEELKPDTVIACSPELGFTNCLDIVQYHDDLVQTFKEDSVFRCMTSEIVTYVSAVLLKERPDNVITVSDIVHCYLDNRQIFDVIQSASDEKLLQVTVASPTAVDSAIAEPVKPENIPKK